MKRLPVFCGKDCGGDACPLLAEVDHGRVERIIHNEAAGPYIKGCPKGHTLAAIHYSPERLRSPLARIGPRGSEQFKEVSWAEATKLVVDGLSSCVERGGPASIMDLSSAGSTGALHHTGRLTRRFLNLLGGYSFSVGSYSSNAANYALAELFGHEFLDSGFEASSLTKSSMIVLLGANILEARLGAELPTRLLEAAFRGTRILSIDPRYTQTARASHAEWIPIRPGTDAALLYSLLFSLDEKGAIDEAFVEKRAEGFGALLDHVRGTKDGTAKTAAWASRICGIEEEAIERLARDWASVKPILLLPGYSIQRSANGEETMRLCVALQLASGNFSLDGGSTGSLNNRLPKPRVGRIGVGSGGEGRGFPVLRWPDVILDGIKSQGGRIRAAYSAGGNHLNQGADIGKNEKALDSLEFMVCHDLFLTPTSRWADVVLPAASPLQKEDIGIPWDGNYLLYKSKILPYEGLERSDYEIFRSLADSFGFEAAYSEGLDEAGWIQRFLEESEIDDVEDFKRKGIYFGKPRRLNPLSSFYTDPERWPLDTISGRLDFCHGFRATFEPRKSDEEKLSFLLVTPKKAGWVHSQGRHLPGKITESEAQLNRLDAEALGLGTNDWMIVSSAQGSIRARAIPSDKIARGVVSLEEGVWHLLPQATGKTKLSSSPNVLTSTEGTKESVSCIMHGIEVRIEKAETDLE